MPLLGNELDQEFLNKVIQKADEIILLLVIDTQDLDKKPFGFVGSEIMQGNALLMDVSNLLKEKKAKVIEVTEWGATLQKIVLASKREQVNKIILKKAENKYFEDLIRALSKETDVELEVI
jgi:hypothetical protein